MTGIDTECGYLDGSANLLQHPHNDNLETQPQYLRLDTTIISSLDVLYRLYLDLGTRSHREQQVCLHVPSPAMPALT